MKQQFSRYRIEIFDCIENETKIIERCVREGQGWKHFGTFSYKGETMQLVSGVGGRPHTNIFTSEEYPPPLKRCKTKRAIDYHSSKN